MKGPVVGLTVNRRFQAAGAGFKFFPYVSAKVCVGLSGGGALTRKCAKNY